jgi:hypothetical protein
MQYGQVSYWYEITDSDGNPLSPRRLSSRQYLPQILEPCRTAPFAVPVPIHGSRNYTICFEFDIPGGTDVSNLRLWMRTSNLKNGMGAVAFNSTQESAFKMLIATPIKKYDCNGSACTAVTTEPHGLSTGNEVEFNFFGTGERANQGMPGGSGAAHLNGVYTVASTPTPSSFTVASAVAAGDWNTGVDFVGVARGKTVSRWVRYADESGKYFGGLHGTQAFEMMIPVTAGEIVAGQTNRIYFRFTDHPKYKTSTKHGFYLLGWALVQPDEEMDQITVSGTTTATPRTTSNHGWSNDDLVLLRDAPGPHGRFNGIRTIGSATSDTFAFTVASEFATANGVHTVPVNRPGETLDPTVHPAPHMYAARVITGPYTTYTPSYPSYGGDAENGELLFNTAIIKDLNDFFPAHVTSATCSDCHNATGYDLKYFGFDSPAIKAAALRRGLTESEAHDIVEYIRDLPFTTPAKGRPWNPPYQPAPGLDAAPLANWAAGGGLDWVLTYDQDMAEFLREDSTPSGAAGSWTGGNIDKWKPAGDGSGNTTNLRETPTFLHMPHWMRWLPAVHPKDFFFYVLGEDFIDSPFWTNYQTYLSVTPGSFASYKANSYMDGNEVYLPLWQLDHRLGAKPGTLNDGPGHEYPAQYVEMYYDVIRWEKSRQWELMHGKQLEGMIDQVKVDLYGEPNARAAPMFTRGWHSGSGRVWKLAPHVSMGGGWTFLRAWFRDSLHWIMDSAIWYHLQAILDNGNRYAQPDVQLDEAYYIGFNINVGLYRPSFYMTILNHAFQTQATWGWDNLAVGNPQASRMTISALVGSNRFQAGQYDLFMPETEKAALYAQIAEQWKDVLTGGTFSDATWREAFALACPTNQAPAPGAFSVVCPQSHIAYALALFNNYGVPDSTLDPVVAWANSVFTGGHDFANDKNATCEFVSGSSPPRWVSCSNF